jgi:tetratricopeptide (TPR) repeat protein
VADQNPEQLLRDAATLRRLGRVPEAIDAYRRLLAVRPDLADSWYNLGLLERQAGLFEEALASYAKALAANIREPEEVHLNRAVIFADHLRDDPAAERELQTALELSPRYTAAIFNLANLREDQGRRDEALALYDRILTREPNAYEALARYAALKGVAGAADPLLDRLRAGLLSPHAAAGQRASLGFALGKLLDDAQQYDAAFAAYTNANVCSRESAGGRAWYSRPRQEEAVDRLIDVFAAPATHAAADSGRPPPIFICGMFRSGSTLAEQILAAHPRATAGGELDILPALVRTALAPFPESMIGASAAKYCELAARYRAEIDRRFPSSDVVTDKRPDNFLLIGLIKRMFPAARIVHTVRDPLDTCLSIYFLHLDPATSYALDLADIGHYYAQYRRLMAHWKMLYPGDILDFDYDALVRLPRTHIERLLTFCGLEWDEACGSPHLARSAVKTASVWQVRQPFHDRSSGRWRNYQRHLDPLRKELARHLVP